MPMIAVMTAAEIAAAEAAAVAAAEAAAAAAAETAAATAATEIGAATAAEAAAAEAAAQAAAQSVAQSGIMGAELAGSGVGSTGAGIVAEAAPAIEAATAVGGQGAGSAGIQQAMQSATQAAGNAPAGITAVPQPAGSVPLTTASDLSAKQQAYMQASQASTNPGIAQGTQALQGPDLSARFAEVNNLAGTTPSPTASSTYSLNTPATAPGTSVQPTASNYSLSSGTGSGPGFNPNAGQPGLKLPSVQTPTAQPSMFDKFSTFAKENPFMTGAAMYTGAYNLGMLDPRGMETPERSKKTYGNQYTMSKDFKASEAVPDIYQPTYKTYAEGGVMAVGNPSSEMPEPRKVLSPMPTASTMAEGGMPSYAKGGTLSSSLDFYKQMAEGQSGKAASDKGDVGIYHDQDPDTRYQDALTAAQIRQAKVNKRANLQLPSGGVMKRPTPMGQLNLAPPGSKKQDSDGATEAARGGIMQAGSSLGGYAAGGNPRLLKGPGDGMSDNIPAMIGRKQPARLADGEFVIPADVVSHLGNGSTEAGAKRLHEMMTKVRKDRTGNPKQGKQINPRKYMPK
jgi:hypothetical protein